MTLINLQEIAKQIEASATKLHQAVRDSREVIIIPASLLAKKYPELEPLKAVPAVLDAHIVRVEEREDGGIYCDTPCVYYSEKSGDVEVYGMGIPAENIAFKSYRTGYDGYCIIEVNGVQLQIRISCDDDHCIETQVGDIEPIEGEGKPPVEYLKPIQRPKKRARKKRSRNY